MGRKLYVGNLPYSAGEQELNDKFGEFGTVESANIISDRNTGRSKGFGFVELPNPDDEFEETIKVVAVARDSVFGGTFLVAQPIPPLLNGSGEVGF